MYTCIQQNIENACARLGRRVWVVMQTMGLAWRDTQRVTHADFALGQTSVSCTKRSAPCMRAPRKRLNSDELLTIQWT